HFCVPYDLKIRHQKEEKRLEWKEISDMGSVLFHAEGEQLRMRDL
ncbi:hypothetical protein JTE90_023195, partial [Oedothorax gibbosus]